jgi:hypothetical protein
LPENDGNIKSKLPVFSTHIYKDDPGGGTGRKIGALSIENDEMWGYGCLYSLKRALPV